MALIIFVVFNFNLIEQIDLKIHMFLLHHHRHRHHQRHHQYYLHTFIFFILFPLLFAILSSFFFSFRHSLLFYFPFFVLDFISLCTFLSLSCTVDKLFPCQRNELNRRKLQKKKIRWKREERKMRRLFSVKLWVGTIFI